MQLEKRRVEIKSDGTHEDLDKITIRVPFKTSYQVQALAKSKRQSVSLYLSKLLAKHVEDPDT